MRFLENLKECQEVQMVSGGFERDSCGCHEEFDVFQEDSKWISEMF